MCDTYSYLVIVSFTLILYNLYKCLLLKTNSFPEIFCNFPLIPNNYSPLYLSTEKYSCDIRRKVSLGEYNETSETFMIELIISPNSL